MGEDILLQTGQKRPRVVADYPCIDDFGINLESDAASI
jgi:hypothetical protein